MVETAQLVRPLPALAVGRVALLGDAAHAMTPDLGQGACQAFEDAVALGAVLTGVVPADVPAALRIYNARRDGRTAALQRAARRMNRLLGLSGPRARLRDGVLRRIPEALATRALAALWGSGSIRIRTAHRFSRSRGAANRTTSAAARNYLTTRAVTTEQSRGAVDGTDAAR